RDLDHLQLSVLTRQRLVTFGVAILPCPGRAGWRTASRRAEFIGPADASSPLVRGMISGEPGGRRASQSPFSGSAYPLIARPVRGGLLIMGRKVVWARGTTLWPMITAGGRRGEPVSGGGGRRPATRRGRAAAGPAGRGTGRSSRTASRPARPRSALPHRPPRTGPRARSPPRRSPRGWGCPAPRAAPASPAPRRRRRAPERSQRDVPVLLGRQALPLGAQRPQRGAHEGAGVRRRDHRVHVTALG